MQALDKSVQTGWFWGEAVLVPTRLPNIGPNMHLLVAFLLGKQSNRRTPISFCKVNLAHVPFVPKVTCLIIECVNA